MGSRGAGGEPSGLMPEGRLCLRQVQGLTLLFPKAGPPWGWIPVKPETPPPWRETLFLLMHRRPGLGLAPHSQGAQAARGPGESPGSSDTASLSGGVAPPRDLHAPKTPLPPARSGLVTAAAVSPSGQGLCPVRWARCERAQQIPASVRRAGRQAGGPGLAPRLSLALAGPRLATGGDGRGCQGTHAGPKRSAVKRIVRPAPSTRSIPPAASALLSRPSPGREEAGGRGAHYLPEPRTVQGIALRWGTLGDAPIQGFRHTSVVTN